MKRQDVVNQISKAIHEVAPTATAILYGSEARGDARQDSDIDLLVLVDTDKLTYAEKDAIHAPFYEIELDTGIVISTMIITRKEWENRPFLTPFQDNINREGIRL